MFATNLKNKDQNKIIPTKFCQNLPSCSTIFDLRKNNFTSFLHAQLLHVHKEGIFNVLDHVMQYNTIKICNRILSIFVQ